MVVYTRRNGEAAQDSAMLRHRVHLSDQVHRVQEIIEERYTEGLRLSDLAAAASVSERTLTRRQLVDRSRGGHCYEHGVLRRGATARVHREHPRS